MANHNCKVCKMPIDWYATDTSLRYDGYCSVPCQSISAALRVATVDEKIRIIGFVKNGWLEPSAEAIVDWAAPKTINGMSLPPF